MYKVLFADKDAYITNRIVGGRRVISSNVGSAGTLDLFKLYAVTSTGGTYNTELSRLFVHFDLSSISDLITENKIDITSPNFDCYLKLFDVYGGQPTPSNFTIAVNPLSRSFDEGLGRDVVQYSDEDVCNFLSGSLAQGAWLMSGCELGGGVPGNVDYITASNGTVLETTQLFATGEENLYVDVTTAISATLTNQIPDEGFRISFSGSIETDEYTYFVKRFAARTAYNEAKRPRLIFRFDDSVQDDSQLLVFDTTGSLFFYNYSMGLPKNVTTSSLELTGQNCLWLKMATEISGGWYELVFSGSQHSLGASTYSTGIYSASFAIPSTDSTIAEKLRVSGSVDFVPIWGSIGGTIAFVTGSMVTVRKSQSYTSNQLFKQYIVSVYGLKTMLKPNEQAHVRVHVFDATSTLTKLTKMYKNMPGIVVRDAHYSVRDLVTNEVVVPFDMIINSTRLSSDADGMWFKLDASNLTQGHNYVIDIKLVTLGGELLYSAASPIFKVSSL